MPPTVRRWINIAHPNEPVALVNELGPLFSPAPGQEPIEDLVLDDGTTYPWHAIGAYLHHDAVRRAVWTAIDPLLAR